MKMSGCKVLATGERMVELLPLEPEIKDTPTARARTIIGQIQFEEVGFRYHRTRGANRGNPQNSSRRDDGVCWP